MEIKDRIAIFYPQVDKRIEEGKAELGPEVTEADIQAAKVVYAIGFASDDVQERGSEEEKGDFYHFLTSRVRFENEVRKLTRELQVDMTFNQYRLIHECVASILEIKEEDITWI